MNQLALAMYIELDLFCLLLLGYIIFKSFRYIETRENWRFFQWALLFIFLFVSSDLAWILMENGILPNNPPLPYIANAVYFVFSVLGTSFWFFYTEAEMGNGNTARPLFMALFSFPMAGMGIMLIISYFNGCLFYFNEEGRYIRGPLNVVAFILPLLYLFFSIIHPLTRLFRYQYYASRKHYLYLSSFALITTAASILQFFMPGTPLPCIGITLASLFVYMNTQRLMVSIDPLTKLNNRQHMVRYLASKMERIDSNISLFLLIIDLDRFKHVNDTYGHVEGDQALIRVAEVLRKAAATYGCFAARYGGDEFVLIFETTVIREIDLLCQFIHDTLEESNRLAHCEYNLSVSIGYARYNSQIHYVPEFIDLADQALYEVKKARRSPS